VALPLLLAAAWTRPVEAAEADPEAAEADPSGIRLGVAAFELSAPPGTDLPDVGTLLADRIATMGVARVVGPDQLGAPAKAAVEPSSVRAWARKAEVDGVVLGRTTQIGTHLSVDVRLLSGESGEVIGTYIAEASGLGQTAAAVDSLAEQVIEGASGLQPQTQAEKGNAGSSTPFAFDSDAPLSIKSQTLEATEVGGRRRLVFEGDVRVVQADVTMTSNRLTADYPEGSSQPSRLVATGAVRVIQGSQEARCDKGTYKRAEELVVCCGHAELLDGANRVRGKCIEFDLNGETVRVEDATVNIVPEARNGDSPASGGDGG
jgi:lipopolysaccharide transport protein LptA